MWVICDVGFFNIVCQDGDLGAGLLTVKARSKKDLEALRDFIPYTNAIEESQVADYRFRIKAPKHQVRGGFATILNEINYPKTKPKLAENNPDRSSIYLRTWAVLEQIQYLDEKA